MTYNVYIPMPLMGMCLSLPIRSDKMRQNHLQQQRKQMSNYKDLEVNIESI